ncbi:DMT family transporter [Micromonospora tulbaghiae]|uniref:Threonine/homoserine efflux transporter RhtA n=1 Tax=Micromonospora tulbaghiae TaxID=479978 RepID=A0ABY0KSG9_9ACTN|nr:MULTISPECIES: EamA family transporter [Micromonospora]NED53625.1 EamA family transporter [Micromonospora aurantiaca]KAB1908816.1 EamA family transporter [Micromonospora sp. AMSO1212t]MCO1613754.1 DMT family transporter [Micromonospora sp. CPM1]MDX5458489.1 DMT family transporter [Micromonospora tulbaghiae]SCF04230.1 Threonine/homoserine efflux transporter RhtA [Micromonospora tulbaghiae]
MRERSGAGLGLALLSAITFATSGTFARPLITGEWSAVAVVIARVGIAALVLAVPAVLALRGRWAVLRRNAVSVVLFGLLGVATAQACFFNAVRYLPVGVALLLEYLGIVLVVGWMWLVHGQRPRLLTVAGSVTALCGLVLVLDLTGAGRLDPVGVLWGLGAGVGLAGYFVIAGRIDAGLPSVVMASGGMAVGALALLLLGGIGALPLAAGTADVTFGGHRVSWLVPIAGLSLIAAVVAYLAGVAGTRLLGARLSSFVGLTEVMFAVLIAWLVLDELPSLIQLAGGVLILGGVALVRADELRGTPSASAPAEPVLAGDR